MADLAFSEYLEDLRDFLNWLKELENTEDIIKLMVKYMDNLDIPNDRDEFGKFVIGKVRREYIIKLLDCIRADVTKELNIDKALNRLNEFMRMHDKESFTNFRKRDKRVIENGMTRRQLDKQRLITRIHKFKNDDNLKQVEVATLVGKSKSTVSKYWNYVEHNGKWVAPIEVEKDKLIEEMWQELLLSDFKYETEDLEEVEQWHIEFEKSIEEIINSPLIEENLD